MSKDLDEELAEVAGLDRAEDAARSGSAALLSDAAALPRDAAAPHTGQRSVGVLVALLVMVAAVVAVFLVGFSEAAIYSVPIDQLLAEQDKLLERQVRIDGELVVGSLRKRDKPCEHRFQLRSNGRVLEVRYPRCVAPEGLRNDPGVTITAEGSLRREGHFEATSLLAKCSSKYDPETRKLAK